MLSSLKSSSCDSTLVEPPVVKVKAEEEEECDNELIKEDYYSDSEMKDLWEDPDPTYCDEGDDFEEDEALSSLVKKSRTKRFEVQRERET